MKLLSTIVLGLLTVFMMSLLVVISALVFFSCTYSINMIHSSGTASDMVDENQEARADVSPNINLHPLR